MIIGNIKDTEKGWFIGNFPKAIFKSEDFEVSWRIHPAGEEWDLHYQEKAIEINLLIDGEMLLNGQVITPGDVFIIPPYEITDVKFIKNCSVVCVKTPSLPSDKVIVHKK